LTDVVPVLERKRRLTQWDIKPPGYENVTAEQAKLSGMFPLPGAPRQQPLDPSRLQAIMNPQGGGAASSAALKPTNSRQSKRLFIYNLPASATDASIAEFFNLQLNGLNVITSQDPCISAALSKDREYALVEFKNAEDATMALALDGITMDDSYENGTNGAGVKAGLSIRRPKDYIAPTVAADDGEHQEGVLSSVVKDSANKLCISNIPLYLTDDQVTELAAAFGELKSFVLVKDTSSEQSRGIAFCEYVDPSTPDIAIEGMNGQLLGDQSLKVTRASVGTTQASGLEMGVNAMSMLAGTTSSDLEQGRVLQLLNMVTAEELMDNDEYEEICADVKEECEKFGTVLEIKVPRPAAGRQTAGVGKIFVKFEDAESAKKAMQSLAGRKFAHRTVVVTFYGEEYFDVNAW
jgi:splicing factor U2AF subunit